MGKRKASEALGENSQRSSSSALAATSQIDFRGEKPSAIASILLAGLPDDVTLQHDDAKSLLKAFDLVRSQLQHRSNVLATTNVETGAEQPLLFGADQVMLPEDAFLQVLDYLPKQEIVHKTSFVCKAWLSCSRTPQLWHTLDNENCLPAKSKKITTMTKLMDVLKRRQFASLKTLVPPEKVKMRKKGLEQIAEACPLLENIDVGYSIVSSMNPHDKDLVMLPSVFPHLKKISHDMTNVTDAGVSQLVETMADRLVELRISHFSRGGYYLSDDTIKTISRCCPNLERFDYELWRVFYDSDRDHLSDEGIIALIRGCPKLKSLTLINTNNVGLAAFDHIARNVNNLSHLFIVGHRDLMSSEDMCTRLSDKVERFEVIEDEEHAWRRTSTRFE